VSDFSFKEETQLPNARFFSQITQGKKSGYMFKLICCVSV